MVTPEGTYCPPSGCLYILADTCVIYTGPTNIPSGIVTGEPYSQVTAKLLAYIAQGAGSPVWGSITGNLSDQTDLQDALNLKANITSLSAVAFSGLFADLLSIPVASTSISGILSSTDWNTFNNKLSSLSANDGLVVTSNVVKLGQTISASGDPAALTENREIPISTNKLTFINRGSSVTTSIFGGFIQFTAPTSKSLFLSASGGLVLTDGTNTLNVINGTSGHGMVIGINEVTPEGILDIRPSVGETDFPAIHFGNFPLTSSPRNGSLEFDNTHLYISIGSSAIRYQLDQQGFGTTAGGELTGTYPNPTVLNSAVIAKVLTGYTSGAGTISATDSILTAIQKLNGNIGTIVGGVSSVSNSDSTLTISPTTGPVVASLNLANANTWTAKQIINTGAANALQITAVGEYMRLVSSTGTGNIYYTFFNSATRIGYIGFPDSGVSDMTMWNQSNSYLTLGTNNTERLRIAAAGDVLIGTTTDNGTDKLQVLGSGAFTVNSVGTTVTKGVSLINSTAATVGAQQLSPSNYFKGNGWATTPSASQAIEFWQYILPIQGTANPIAEFIIDATVNAGTVKHILSVRSDGYLKLYNQSNQATYSTIINDVNGFLAFGSQTGGSININIPAGSNIRTSSGRSGAGSNTFLSFLTGSATNTSGDSILISLSEAFQPTSGTATYAALAVQGTINQTGGANGSARGIWINPTITAAADYRAIEIPDTKGCVLIGTSTSVPSALLVVSSTTKGFLPPVMTTTQKNAISSPALGLIVFDSTLGKLCVKGASAWETITSV